MCKNAMRIHMTESRERRFEHLLEATGEATKSKAIDKAVGYYLRMRGGTDAYPEGHLVSLMAAADEQGSLTAEEIASILNCQEIPVSYEPRWSVGSTLD